MTLVALCSAKGSPGVTTLACALAAVWPADRGVVVAECDPSGGDLAARFGLSQRRGMTSLVLAQRQDPTNRVEISSHVQRLTGGMEVLVAPFGSESAANVDRELGRVGAAALNQAGDLIADCGRLAANAPGQTELVSCADRVLAVVRPDIGGLARTRALVERIRALSPDAEVILVTVGPSSFTPREMQKVVDVDRLDSVPLDPRAAAILSGTPGVIRSFARSPLIVWARRNIETIAYLVGENGETNPTGAPVDAIQSGGSAAHEAVLEGRIVEGRRGSVSAGVHIHSLNGSTAGKEEHA